MNLAALVSPSDRIARVIDLDTREVVKRIRDRRAKIQVHVHGRKYPTEKRTSEEVRWSYAVVLRSRYHRETSRLGYTYRAFGLYAFRQVSSVSTRWRNSSGSRLEFVGPVNA